MAFLLLTLINFRVQNAAARLVTNTPRICNITPIKYRIEFKVVLLTFKCLYELSAPQYLVDLIAVAAQSRYNLRSRNATLFVPVIPANSPKLYVEQSSGGDQKQSEPHIF